MNRSLLYLLPSSLFLLLFQISLAQPIHTTGSTNSDDVGIGTATPSAKLHIFDANYGSTPALLIEGQDANNNLSLSVQGLSGGNNHTQISTALADSRLTLKCGNITDKAPRLQMTGANDASSNKGWALFDYGSREVLLDNANFKMRWMPGNASDPAIDMIQAQGTSFVALAPSAGSVGIGTANPQELLHVAGTIRSDALAGTGDRYVMVDENGNFIEATSSPGGGGTFSCSSLSSCTLTSLGDVDVPSPLVNKVLKFNGVNWAAGDDQVNDADSDPLNEIQFLSANGNNISLSNGNTVSISVNDADASPANELIGSVSLLGNILRLIDAGGTYNVDLSPLQDGVDDADADSTNELQILSVSGSDITISDGNTISVNVNDADADPTNETISNMSVLGTILSIEENGNTSTIDLAAIQDGVDDADPDPANEYNTSLGVNGSSLEITDGGGTLSVNLGSLIPAATDADWLLSGGGTPGSNTDAIHTQGNVGVYVSNPGAALHVGANQDVVFGAAVTGSGSKTLWLAGQSAFRAGSVTGATWDAVNVGINSFAAGSNPLAKGIASVAMGFNTQANGNYSTAMGLLSQAGGDYSIAMGLSCIAAGAISTSLGTNCNASGGNSIVIGSGSSATSQFSIALGNQNTSSGPSSVSIGDGNSAVGSSGVAIGLDNVAQGASSVALGENNQANNLYTVSIGRNNNSGSVGSVTIGTDNSAMNSYALALGSSTTASGTNSTSMGFQTEAKGNFSTAMGRYNSSSFTSLSIGQYNIDTGADSAFIGTDYLITAGDGTSPTNRSNCMYVLKNGNMWLQGGLTQTSDRRMKEEIQPLENAMEKLKQINGVSYYWKDRERMGEELQIGVIAQDVEAVFPELTVAVEDHKAVNYIGLIPVLIEAMKEQESQYENRMSKLEAENLALKAQMQEIQQSLSRLDEFEMDLQSCCTKISHTSHSDAGTDMPRLGQNRPNPFQDQTIINYYLPKNSPQAFIELYDRMGNSLGTWELKNEGHGEIEVPSQNLSEGYYLYRLVVGGQLIDAKKMEVIR